MSRLEHLTHVQGLRALAIIAIIFYHLESGLCPCGYFGVDAFLVITGYFLARNDMPKLRERMVGTSTYWVQKAWRIMPPWMVVALPVCVISYFIMEPSRLESIFGTASSSALCFSNEYVAASGGYFKPDTQENPLMHLWYIGLTLQLYILTPMVALAFQRFRQRWQRLFLALVGLASMTLYFMMTDGQQIAAIAAATAGLQEWLSPYYSLLTRAWEPLCGAALACMAPPAGGKTGRDTLLSLLGLALLIAPMYMAATGSTCVYAAILGTLLLVRYGAGGAIGALLSCAPMRGVGAVSFSLYIVHWPVFVLWKYITFNHPGLWGEVGMLVVAVLLGLLLWWGIEKRCGKWSKACPRCLFSGIPLTAMAAVGATGFYMVDVVKSENVIAPEISCFSHRFPPPAHIADLKGFDTSVFEQLPLSLGTAEIPASYLLLGDSHAWHLAHGLNICSEEAGVRGIYFRNSCIPAWDYTVTNSDSTPMWDQKRAEAFLAWLEKHPEIRCIVVSIHWYQRMDNNRSKDWSYRSIPREQLPQYMTQGILEMCRHLQAMGKRIVFIEDTPLFPRTVDPYDEAVRCAYLKKECPNRITTKEYYTECNACAQPLFHELQAQGLARVVETCSVMERDGAYPFRDTDGRFLYRDTNHLSTLGSILVARHILPVIIEQAKEGN